MSLSEIFYIAIILIPLCYIRERKIMKNRKGKIENAIRN